MNPHSALILMVAGHRVKSWITFNDCLLSVKDVRFTLPIIFTDTRSLGKSLRLASSLLPKGGFLLMSISIRCGSAASKASMLLIPPMVSFRIATRPICAICFISKGELSQTLAPKLLASSKACRTATASCRKIWQSITQHINRWLAENSLALS